MPRSRVTDGSRPLIAHVLFRLDYGGLENGVINLINHMPQGCFRHCVIALTEATEFRDRIRKADVTIHELGKHAGKDLPAYWRLFRLLRKLRPNILHTRNVGTLDCVLFGWMAGVTACVHGEHGWDTHDPDGTSAKYRYLRRFMNPLVRRFVTVSVDLRQWLIDVAGIPPDKITRICNGVDTEQFRPAAAEIAAAQISERFGSGVVIVGGVLRFNEIKDPMNLVEAFIMAYRRAAQNGIRVGLVMLGDGPLWKPATEALQRAGMDGAYWLPGSRDDVPSIMRSFDLFVLGSRREGISNTLLEAMASGVPVIATATGGNTELVRPEADVGTLVPTGNRLALSEAIYRYIADAELRIRQGEAARKLALAEYSIEHMVNRYRNVYEDVLTPVGV